MLLCEFDKKKHILKLSMEEQILELQLSDDMRNVGDVAIEEEWIRVSYIEDKENIDLYYEIYCEECTGNAVNMEYKKAFVEKMLEANRAGKLVVVVQ